MTVEKRLTIGIPTALSAPTPTTLEATLTVAQHQVFPFLKLTFVETNKKQGYDAQIEMSPAVREFLAKRFAGNETVMFLDLGEATTLGVFGSEMMESLRLLSKYGLMSRVDQWLISAQNE